MHKGQKDLDAINQFIMLHHGEKNIMNCHIRKLQELIDEQETVSIEVSVTPFEKLYCPNCASVIKMNDKYCRYCGRKIKYLKRR